MAEQSVLLIHSSPICRDKREPQSYAASLDFTSGHLYWSVVSLMYTFVYIKSLLRIQASCMLYNLEDEASAAYLPNA